MSKSMLLPQSFVAKERHEVRQTRALLEKNAKTKTQICNISFISIHYKTIDKQKDHTSIFSSFTNEGHSLPYVTRQVILSNRRYHR